MTIFSSSSIGGINSVWPDVWIKSWQNFSKSWPLNINSIFVQKDAFKIAKKLTNIWALGTFWKKFCHQERYKIGQSGHTGGCCCRPSIRYFWLMKTFCGSIQKDLSNWFFRLNFGIQIWKLSQDNFWPRQWDRWTNELRLS